MTGMLDYKMYALMLTNLFPADNTILIVPPMWGLASHPGPILILKLARQKIANFNIKIGPGDAPYY